MLRFFGVMFLQKDGLARLDFVQNMDYKFLELLSLDFAAAGEDAIRQNITFRYNVVKTKSQFFQNRLNDMGQILKLKNPSIYHQLQKSSKA